VGHQQLPGGPRGRGHRAAPGQWQLDPIRSTWTQAQIDNVLAEIMNAATGWRPRTRPWNGSFDIHASAPCDYEPILHPSSDINTIIENTIHPSPRQHADLRVGLAHGQERRLGLSGLCGQRHGLPECNGAFSDGRFGFTYIGGPRLIMTYNNDGWGIGHMDAVFVHEAGHDFGTLDEYSGGQAASTQSGYYSAPNSNAYAGGTLNDIFCPMRGWGDLGTGHYCAASRLHLGWKDDDSDGLANVLDTLPNQNWAVGQPTNVTPGAAVPLVASVSTSPRPA